jgi:hypothetical protein
MATLVNIPYKPRGYFWPYHHRTQRFSVVAGHRRAGKTVAHVYDLVRRVVECQHPEPRGSYIAPLYSQAKDIAWNYLRSACAPFMDKGAKVYEADLMAVLPGNRQIRLYGADRGAGERLRGTYQDAVVVDEPEDISDWSQFYNYVLLPTLSDRQGYLSIIGTPKGRGNLYRIVREAEKDPDWFVAIIRATDTDVFTPAALAKLEQEMGDHAFRQEYLLDWNVEADQQFISGRDIDLAIERTPIQSGEHVIGVDVARQGSDRSCIITRNSSSIDHIVVRRNLDLMQLADLVAEEHRRFKPVAVFVDATGIGAGVVDALRRLGVNAIEVYAGATPGNDMQFVNKRAEMFWGVREWIKSGASLRVEAFQQELADDLTAIMYDYDPRNRLKLESKDKIRSRGLPSPDLADALSMTFFQRIVPKEIRDAIKVSWAAPEASPFAEL